MRLHVADHPLITHKLTVLRNRETSSPVFRQLTEELVTLLAYEATRNVRVSPIRITTPVTETMGVKISEPRPLVVPILTRCLIHNHRFKILNSQPNRALEETAERHVPIIEALRERDLEHLHAVLGHHISTIVDFGPDLTDDAAAASPQTDTDR